MTTEITTSKLIADRVQSIEYWKQELAVLRRDQKAITKTTKHEVTSMKEGIAPAFMRSLLEAGFDVEATKDTTSSSTARRTFDFKRPGSDRMIAVELTFNASLVDSPDATCRKVQTGTEIKEVPTYQLVCEE